MAGQVYPVGHPAIKELCDVMGIKSCKSMDIRIRMDECVTVTAECLIESPELGRMVSILRRFRLEEID